MPLAVLTNASPIFTLRKVNGRAELRGCLATRLQPAPRGSTLPPIPGTTMRITALALLAPSLGLATLHEAGAQSTERDVRSAVERYNTAFTSKDLTTLKSLLAPEIVLFEHSVRNIGLDDVWDNHLRPEVSEFDDATAEFTNVRIAAGTDMALVTRTYAIRATMQGKPIDARGNETMVWALRDGQWLVTHIHYSHPCPRPNPS